MITPMKNQHDLAYPHDLAYTKGRIARFQGMSIDDNPYGFNLFKCYLANEWVEGWKDANREYCVAGRKHSHVLNNEQTQLEIN